MALLTPVALVRTGLDIAGISVAADALGDEWLNTGAEFVSVKNGSGGSINVTLDIKSTVDGASVTDPVVAVAAGVTKLIGPFPKGIYNDPLTGRAKVTYSAVTSVTVAIIRGSMA